MKLSLCSLIMGLQMNKLDKYGFSKLLHLQYWQKGKIEKTMSTNERQDHWEAVKEYLASEDVRLEILKLYNKYIDFDAKYFIENGYAESITDVLDFTTFKVDNTNRELFTKDIYCIELEIGSLNSRKYFELFHS